MKVSREEAAANRERVVDTASRLFREKGFDGIGVADLMKGAGLTHGGFYGQFKSKEHLAEEACARTSRRSQERWKEIVESAGDDAFEALVKNYLSQGNLEKPASACVFAALGPDASRQGKAVRRVFTEGFEGLVEILSKTIAGRGDSEKRKKAIAAFAEMVGAVVLARSVADAALAREIVQTVCADLTAEK